jgi:hypothetical protein
VSEDADGSSTRDGPPGTDAPPVATPTDPAAGLRYGTLVHAPFSGDAGAAASIGDADDPEEVASRAGLATIRTAPARAAGAVERLLRPRPSPDGPVATVEGLADVLDTAARTDPGAALALALGGAADPALDAWRAAGERVHATLRQASVSAADGIDRVQVPDAEEPSPVELLARLHHECRSTAKGTVVLGTDRVGIAAAAPLTPARDAIETAIGSALSVGPGGTTARARTETADSAADESAIAAALAEVTA